MNITIEACKPESYVGCPAPKVDLPECENGWEVGNGTVACAEPYVVDPLAATGLGLDPTLHVVLAFGLILAGAVGMVGGSRMMRHGRELRKAAKR
jgi:hypothetical protein